MRVFWGLVLATLTLPLFSASASASNKLRWAADTQSGAPYVFQDPSDSKRLIGFEADIVKAIADELGQEPEFVQNTWDSLIPGLSRGEYDIAINGIEITEDRRQEVYFTHPYYITFQSLTVRKDENLITDLKTLKNHAVGTLKGSLAERILHAQEGVEVRAYEEEFAAYLDLQNKRLDAVLLDDPIAQYYAKPNRNLKTLSEPFGRLEYGIVINKKNQDTQEKVEAALAKITQNGKLREILEYWNLWTPVMAKYIGDERPNRTRPAGYEKYLESTGQKATLKDKILLYVGFLPQLLKAAVITVKISVFSMLIAMSLGLFIALVRLFAPLPLSLLATAYIEVIRGTPLLIQLFFIFYGLPNIGIKLSPMVAALLGLGLNYAAYEAENYRAGILSVPRAQMDAAYALGMTRLQALRHVIIPQALRLVIPPVTNDFISLLKDSSLVSVVTLVELTRAYGQLASTYFDYFGIGLMVAAIYFLLGLPFVRLARWLEAHLEVDRRLARNLRQNLSLEGETLGRV